MSMLCLNLPSSSDAFKDFHTPVKTNTEHQSPPRKIAKLHDDGGRGGASARSRLTERGKARVTLSFQDDGSDAPEIQLHNTEFRTVQTSIRVLLSREANETLPAIYEAIFRACQVIVMVYKDGDRLHGALRLELEQCISALATKELETSKQKGLDWIKELNEVCTWFEKRVMLIQSLLTYLDRVYLLEEAKSPSIKDMAFRMFTDRVLDYQPISQRILAAVDVWVTWERENREEHKLRPSMKELVGHLVVFNRYTPLFETKYFATTEAFFAKEATKLAVDLREDAAEFMKAGDTRLSEEEKRCKEVLLPETLGPVSHTTLVLFLQKDRLSWLTSGALESMMAAQNEDAIGNLKGLFQLVERVGGLAVLADAFKTHIQNEVERIVKDDANDDKMIALLLDLKSFADRVVETSFISTVSGTVDTPDFAYAVRSAFSNGFKVRRQKPAELLAKHLDRTMRRGQRGTSDYDYNDQLKGVLALHRFTDDKDVFRTFYHRLLAKRLLLSKSASDDFEKSVLKMLKEEYDDEFHMGDQMFKDLHISRDLMTQYYRTSHAAEQNVSVMVLQRSFWPFSVRRNDIVLPIEMQKQVDGYNTYYQNKFKGRKLDFDHGLGTTTLKARFKEGNKELSVSLYQASILLLFNDADELVFTEIKTATRMDPPELRRTLQSLALGKVRVLKKKGSKGKDVNDDDVFVFNDAFTDSRATIHISSIQAQETVEETKHTEASIRTERGYTLDAAIVRIMKSKRRLHYEELKAAVIVEVKAHFVPEVALIKKRISDLVEQEYMERDDDDMNMYTYCA